MRKLISWLLPVLAALPLRAAEPVRLAERLALDVSESGIASRTLNIPPLQIPEGREPVLCFNARIVAPTPAGWSNILQIVLNGKELGAKLPDGRSRLLGRGRLF